MGALGRSLTALSIVAMALVAVTVSASRRQPAGERVSAEAAARVNADAAPDSIADATTDATSASIADARTPIVEPRDAARIAWLLSSRSAGTYLGEMLAGSDSMNHRWPDRRHAPMRIWVQELAGGTPGWEASFPQLVRDAFTAWGDAGVPIHLTFVTDSVRGEVHVTWADRFEEEMTGRTRWAHDRERWIVGGSIQLALHMPDGRPLGREAVRAIALHEVGHLIGLDHTADAANVMSARVRVSELSEADRLTVRLVYSLPPGSLKGRR